MRFVLYTDKTVSQSMSALNERLHAKGTSSRPTLDGWVEKNGRFAMNVSTAVAQQFSRRTELRGEIKREFGMTVIKGDVPSGAPPRAQLVIYVMLALVGVGLFFIGNAILAIVTAVAAAALYIPLTGDHQNSELLVSEVQRTLKAKDTPPKVAPVKSITTRPGGAAASKPVKRAASSKTTSTKPAAKKPSGTSKMTSTAPRTPVTARTAAIKK